MEKRFSTEYNFLDPVIVGKVIRKARLSKGISMDVLGGLSVLNTSHIGMIERGIRKPTLETLFRISDGLQIRASELVLKIEREMGDCLR